MNDTTTISEPQTTENEEAPSSTPVPSGRPADAEQRTTADRPPHFWAEYRARRGERIPRADLRLAITLSGEPFCRLALASDVPFARSCAEEARGTRGELREALLRLALGGGRPVARELARRRSRELGDLARAMEVDQSQLDAALQRVGAEAAERVLEGRVGFRKAALFEAAMRGGDAGHEEAWVALAASGAGRVRGALRRLGAGHEAAPEPRVPAEPRPPRGTAFVASAGDAELRSPFGADLARAVADAA